MINLSNYQEKPKSLRRSIFELPVGCSMEFKLSQVDSVRAIAGLASLKIGKKFSTHIVRDRNVVIVTHVE